MKVFIQQTSGRYWSHQDGWVQTRGAATLYNGVVPAVDAFIEDRLGRADILNLRSSPVRRTAAAGTLPVVAERTSTYA